MSKNNVSKSSLAHKKQFTAIFESVRLLYFLRGVNFTYKNHSYDVHLFKSTISACNQQLHESTLGLTCRYARFQHRNHVNFDFFRSRRVLIFSVNSKLVLNRKEFGKIIKTKKLRLVNSFPTPYHLLCLDKRCESNCQNIVHRI